MENRKKKATIEIDYFTGMIIAIAFGVVAIIITLILKGKGSSAISYIQNLFRFGG